jgi:hypothetical protein
MTTFVDSRFVESVQRLALGLEPLDALRRTRVPVTLEVRVEGDPAPWKRIQRHPSCLHVLLHGPDVETPIDVRLSDRSRRFVPRRLRYPFATYQVVLDAEEAGAPVPAAARARRPLLFPGAAYDISPRQTGLRGRARRAGAPLRWARVEARLPGGGPLLGRAHGDDRGEFLLVLGVDPVNLGDLVSPLAVEVTVTGPTVAPVPASPGVPALDPLWDLPLEQGAAPGAPDPVSLGESLPAAYVPGVTETRQIDFPLGRITSETVPFEPA